MKKHKFLSIAQVASQDPNISIWAINNSPMSSIERAGEITIPIPKPNGAGYNHLSIPMTWLPIELTSQIPRDQLLQSVELRHAINEELIGLISEKDASHLMGEPEARAERKRLREARSQVQLAVSRALSNDGSTEAHVVNPEDSGTKSGSAVTQNFRMWVSRMAQQPDRKIVNEIRIRRVFKIAQIKFMLSELSSKTDTVSVLNEMLEQRRAAKRAKNAAK